MAWLSGWAKRIEITIDSDLIDSNLSDFPLPIYLSADSGIDSDDVSSIFDELGSDANRKKIAVTLSDGETECYVEIERWDDANEKAWLHVKIPSVSSSTDTVIYLYYDSSQSDNTSYVGDTGDTPAKSVWDSNFAGVYMLDSDPTSSVVDSTTNARHGTAYNMGSGNVVDGQFGKALDFNGSDEYISTFDISATAQLMIEAIVRSDQTRVQSPMSDVTAADAAAADTFNNNGQFWGRMRVNGFNKDCAGGTWAKDTWYHYALYYDGSNVELVVNGASIQKITGLSGSLYSAAVNFKIGRRGDYSGSSYYMFDGKIQHVRISYTGRSLAWAKATYNGLFDSLLTFGAEESAGEILGIGNAATIRSLAQAITSFQWDISGIVQEGGSPVARTVRLYKRSDGSLVDSTTSDGGDGSFSFEDVDPEQHFVVAFDDAAGEDYNAQIYDKVAPKQVVS